MDLNQEENLALEIDLEEHTQRLGNQLINYEIFKRIAWFLSLKDILILSQTCRSLNDFVEKHQEYFAEIYYSLYLNEQLEMTLALSYPDKDERTVRRKHFFHNSISQWKEQLKKMSILKQRLTIPFLLCDSVLPKPILRRETIGIFCETEYQIMLAQRLELEQKGFEIMFGALFIQNDLMNQLKQNKQQIISEMSSIIKNQEIKKKQFLQQRWYFYEEEIKQSDCAAQFEDEDDLLLNYQQLSLQRPQQQQIENENQECEIIDLMNQVYESIECYLKGLQMYFNRFSDQKVLNSIDILSEYVMYWQAYSNTIIELSTMIFPLENIINELHEQVFPKYPQYPKFSIWRTMIKLWIKYIIKNNKFSAILSECFIRLLCSERQQIFIKQFEEGANQDQDELQPFQITYEIYDNFLLKQRISYQAQFTIETSHNIYKNQSDIIDLMRNFCRSVQDISISEVSVHWVGHKDCRYEELYDQLSDKIQHETSLFYDESRPVFGGNISSFIEFIKFDKEFVEQFLPEPLILKIENLQREHIFTTVYYYLEQYYLENYVQNNKELIINFYKQQQLQTPKQERVSMTSSQNNEYLETQGDQNLNETQKLFNLALENTHIDFDEMVIKEKNKFQPEPIIEMIKVSLSQMNLDELQQQEEQFQLKEQNDLNKSIKIKKAYSSHKINYEFYHEVPEELIKSVKSFLLTDQCFSKLYQIFNDYNQQFDKYSIKMIQKDREIEIINNEREIPMVLPEYLQQFYHITQQMTQEILDENIQGDDEEDNIQGNEDDFDGPPSLTKNSSKQLRGSVQMEYYYSEEEEDNEDDENKINNSKP